MLRGQSPAHRAPPPLFGSEQTAWLRGESKTSYESSIVNRTARKRFDETRTEVRGRAMNVE